MKTNSSDMVFMTGNYAVIDNEKQNFPNHGLTKREYFAAMALQGELAQDNSYSKSDACIILGIDESEYKWQIHYPLFAAKRSVQYADALIKALNETK